MSDLEIPDFPMILMEPLLSVPEASRVGFIAQLERTAAQRYRDWAEESEEMRAELLECAAREDEIADRAERLRPVAPGDEAIVASALNEASKLYSAQFDHHTLADRMTLQAHAERQGALAWIGLAGQTGDEAEKAEFMELAGLEVASAEQMDRTLDIDTSRR